MAGTFLSNPGTLGLYTVGVSTGNITATLAANAPLFALRWSSSTRFFILESLRVAVTVSAVITTSVATSLELIAARSYSVADTGGTALTLTGDNNTFKSAFDTSLVADARIATTGTLTAGTRTLDSQALASIPFVTGAAIGVALEPTTLFDRLALFPLVLDTNEGFVIRNGAAGPATGTFVVHVNLKWQEVVRETLV